MKSYNEIVNVIKKVKEFYLNTEEDRIVYERIG